jgi:hypothetical protein
LQQSYQSYVIGTRRGSQITDSFLMGSDFGWFCPRCPTVVIDPTQVKRRIEHPLAHWDTGTDFTILGLANLDAVPPEKDDVPLGDEGNPIPLVRFIAPRRERGPAQPGNPGRPASGRKKPKSKKRRS